MVMGEMDRQFTLLLVDDNPTNLLLLVKIIELDLPGVKVLTAETALEGVELAKRQHIDGAFIDVQMPGMDGLEMCRRLRALPQTATIPLVLMTAHIASPEMRAEGLEVGAHDFILQPISNVEMLARIKVMLRLCESEQRSSKTRQQLQQQRTEHSDRLSWIRGLLFSGHGSLADIDQQLLQKLVDELPDPSDIDEKQFFDKMATEFPLPWRRTLLKLALFDHVPMALAEKLSEISDVKALCDYLNQHHMSLCQLLDGEDCLFFKPHIKDSLRLKAKQILSEPERQQIGLLAAEWYRQQDRYVATLDCLILTEQYSAVSQFFNQLGFRLLEKKYRGEIFSLVNTIPDDVAAQYGWIALFRGSAYLQERLAQVDYWLTLAYQLFSAGSDPRGQLLALTQQVRQAICLEGSFERWMELFPVFRRLASELSDSLERVERLKVVYSLGMAELFFGGGYQTVDALLPKALSDAQQSQLVEQRLELNVLRAFGALQQGRYLVAYSAIEQALESGLEAGDALENEVLQIACCGLIHASGDFSGLQIQRQILLMSCQRKGQLLAGLKPLLSYYTAGLFLAKGQQQRALEIVEIALIDGYAGSAHLQSRLLQLRGWIKALNGDEEGALNDIGSGLQQRKRSGGIYFRLESLLYAGTTSFSLGHYHQAVEYFSEALTGSLDSGEERFRPGLHFWMAVAQFKLGNVNAADAQIKAFLELLQRHRLTFFWGLIPGVLREVLPLIKDQTSLNLLQPLVQDYLDSSLDSEGRLFPLFKIHCLGRFELELGENTYNMSQAGQASRQILSLLIVAPNNIISSELIMGSLWPDSSPQKARNNFDAAHSRLRKELEKCFGKQVRKDYLVLEKGMLSLRHTTIDSSSFDEMIEKSRYHMQREHFWQAEHVLWKMDRLWNGEFLSGYDLNGDLSLQRDRLTQLRLEQLGVLAQLQQKRREFGAAATTLKRGLLLDPTHDSMVRKLQLLYQQQNDNHAIEMLLEQYRKALLAREYAPEEIDELIDALGA